MRNYIKFGQRPNWQFQITPVSKMFLRMTFPYKNSMTNTSIFLFQYKGCLSQNFICVIIDFYNMLSLRLLHPIKASCPLSHKDIFPTESLPTVQLYLSLASSAQFPHTNLCIAWLNFTYCYFFFFVKWLLDKTCERVMQNVLWAFHLSGLSISTRYYTQLVLMRMLYYFAQYAS